MNYPINLHAHSPWSDGADTIKAMAIKCKELGFTACVITDHVSGVCRKKKYTALTASRYLLEREEARKVAQEVGIPIIVGIELSLSGSGEEVCVFGKDVILELFALRDIDHIDIPTALKAKTNHPSVFVHNHPRNIKKFLSQGGHHLVDAYEGYNDCDDWLYGDIPTEYLSLPQLCNSDAHSVDVLESCWNLTVEPITTEAGLIEYIRQRKPVSPVTNMPINRLFL